MPLIGKVDLAMQKLEKIKCPLCGENSALMNKQETKYIHKEHVPPKCVFEKNSQNLITVPSCQDCNAGTSNIDENFKVHLGLYLGTFPRWNAAMKTLRHESNVRLLNELRKNTASILTKDSRGIYGHQIKIPKVIFERTVNKIIRGLHYHVTKRVLPSTVEVRVFTLKQGFSLDKQIRSELLSQECIGNGQFCFIYTYASDQEDSSVWLLTFHGQEVFFCVVDGRGAI